MISKYDLFLIRLILLFTDMGLGLKADLKNSNFSIRRVFPTNNKKNINTSKTGLTN